MKGKLLYIIILLLCAEAFSQSQGTAEHYYYITKSEMPVMVPMVHYTTSKNWYAEARYNYEDFNTLSLYGGKTFSKEGDFSMSATPLLGGMVGLMNGGSLGLNFESEYGNLFLSSQSQYSFSLEDKMNKYFFTWSEMGYQLRQWCYAGVALQQTSMYKEAGKWETGYMIGFSFKKWTIPFYVFSPSKQEKYFIVGLNWEWNNQDKRISKNDL